MMFILLVPSQRVNAVLGITKHQLSTASLSAPPSKSITSSSKSFTSCRLWTTCKRPGCSSSQTTLCATCRCPSLPFERTPPNSGFASSSTSVAGGLASSRHPAFRPQPIAHPGPAQCPPCARNHPNSAKPYSMASHTPQQLHLPCKLPTMQQTNSGNKAGIRPLCQSPRNNPQTQRCLPMKLAHPLFTGGGTVQQPRLPTPATHTAMQTELFQTLGPASQAMMASQSGPFGSRTFTTIPYTEDLAYPSHFFHICSLDVFVSHCH